MRGVGLLALLALADRVARATCRRRRSGAGHCSGWRCSPAGCASSLLHLASPRHAWRVIRARAHVLAVARSPRRGRRCSRSARLYVAAADRRHRRPRRAPARLGHLPARLDGARVHGHDLRQPEADPAMAYALDPGQLPLLGHWSGAMLVAALACAYAPRAGAFLGLAAILGGAALAGKLAYWRSIGAAEAALTLERAIGVAEGVRGPAPHQRRPRSSARCRTFTRHLSDPRIRLRPGAAACPRTARRDGRAGLRPAARVAGHRLGALAARALRGGLLYHRPAGRALAFLRRSQAYGPAVSRRSSNMTAQWHVQVWRGGADGRFQAYDVPRRDAQTVLDVVTYIQRRLDPTLAYRFACRVGMCGSCAMSVNGRPRWTCRTHVAQVAPANRLELAPLANLPIVRDLVTDMREFFAKGARAKGSVPSRPRTRDDDFAAWPGVAGPPRDRCRDRMHRLRRVLRGLRRRRLEPRLSRPGGAQPRLDAGQRSCATARGGSGSPRSPAMPAAMPVTRTRPAPRAVRCSSRRPLRSPDSNAQRRSPRCAANCERPDRNPAMARPARERGGAGPLRRGASGNDDRRGARRLVARPTS